MGLGSMLYVVSVMVLVYAACVAAAAAYAYFTKKSKSALMAGGATFLSSSRALAPTPAAPR